MNRCKQCNAVVNPKWKKCLVCEELLGANEPQEYALTHEQICSMTLVEFTKKNLAIKVYSEVLGELVWMVSNEKLIHQVKDDGSVTYLPSELEYLLNLKATPDDIKKIHAIKESFSGSKIVWN